jgi:hypothetical protein
MTLSFLDVALPVGLGAVFGAYRYIKRIKAKVPNALSSSVADALKGTAGLAIITLGYKLVFPS